MNLVREEPSPEPDACQEAIKAIRRNREALVTMLDDYPVMCSMPGYCRMLTKESDIDELITRLEGFVRAKGSLS